MGAHNQQDFAIGRFKTAVEAYNKLVEETEVSWFSATSIKRLRRHFRS